ncbi:hypothetical protein M427DRAFT_39916 [Gonapodya prolifera JEL478]|uniref:Uncharacterized protein n=1 Tax=Gonapodya prolifera (strain JEL478) TaxID=1344416 RepID=A0A138ZWD2_GONPJ|nr:hypothetical protein M427DRAFT_39916 [Gonapodya prolifera JEL478]|eukprot:KXS08819.1 hypothetical protein M427DRAFT_39916 [Gonapodya prolifera JEL478]
MIEHPTPFKAPKAPKASGKSLTVQLKLPSLISDTMKKWIMEDLPKKVKLRHIKQDSYTDIQEIYQDGVAAIKVSIRDTGFMDTSALVLIDLGDGLYGVVDGRHRLCALFDLCNEGFKGINGLETLDMEVTAFVLKAETPILEQRLIGQNINCIGERTVSDGIDAASKLKSKWTNDDVLTMLPGAGFGAQIKKLIPMVQVAVKVPGTLYADSKAYKLTKDYPELAQLVNSEPRLTNAEVEDRAVKWTSKYSPWFKEIKSKRITDRWTAAKINEAVTEMYKGTFDDCATRQEFLDMASEVCLGRNRPGKAKGKQPLSNSTVTKSDDAQAQEGFSPPLKSRPQPPKPMPGPLVKSSLMGAMSAKTDAPSAATTSAAPSRPRKKLEDKEVVIEENADPNKPQLLVPFVGPVLKLASKHAFASDVSTFCADSELEVGKAMEPSLIVMQIRPDGVDGVGASPAHQTVRQHCYNNILKDGGIILEAVELSTFGAIQSDYYLAGCRTFHRIEVGETPTSTKTKTDTDFASTATILKTGDTVMFLVVVKGTVPGQFSWSSAMAFRSQLTSSMFPAASKLHKLEILKTSSPGKKTLSVAFRSQIAAAVWMELLLLMTNSGDAIFAPIVGCGSLAIACAALGRHFYGMTVSSEILSGVDSLVAKPEEEFGKDAFNAFYMLLRSNKKRLQYITQTFCTFVLDRAASEKRGNNGDKQDEEEDAGGDEKGIPKVPQIPKDMGRYLILEAKEGREDNEEDDSEDDEDDEDDEGEDEGSGPDLEEGPNKLQFQHLPLLEVMLPKGRGGSAAAFSPGVVTRAAAAVKDTRTTQKRGRDTTDDEGMGAWTQRGRK